MAVGVITGLLRRIGPGADGVVVEATVVVVACVVAALVFGTVILLSRVEVDRRIMAGIVAIFAVAVLAGGIVGAAAGERDFHHTDEAGEHS